MRILLALLALPLIVACASAPPPDTTAVAPTVAPPDTVSDWPGFQSRIHRDGRVFISGQPSADALRGLPARGVGLVVNLRTPREMENRERVPFDEAALLDSLGVDYVHIPLGGKDHPYTPAAVDAFAAAFDGHEGPVLLHCTAAWRASHLWAAYLVVHGGLDLDTAYSRGEITGIGKTPFEQMLDRPLRVVPDEVR